MERTRNRRRTANTARQRTAVPAKRPSGEASGKPAETAPSLMRRVKKKFRIFSIRAGLDMPLFLLVLVLLVIGLVMMFSASYAKAYYYYEDS